MPDIGRVAGDKVRDANTRQPALRRRLQDKGGSSLSFRAAVKSGPHLFSGPLAGRPRESVPGSNACVRQVTKGATHVSHGRTRMYAPGLSAAGTSRSSMVTQGLCEAWKRSAMLRAKLSALLQSCYARRQHLESQ
jgi:hypothetical protein